MVLQMAVEWRDGGIVVARNGGALPEIKRENAEPVPVGITLIRAAGHVQELEDLPTVLSAVPVVSDYGVEDVELRCVRRQVSGVGNEGRNSPDTLFLPLLGIKKRPKSLGSPALSERERELME